MSEKQKENPNKSPESKKETERARKAREKKEIKQEIRKELTKNQLDDIQDQVGHTVIAGENIWRIIYNHAKETGKTPIKPEKLEGINISIGDKVFFTNNEVIIKYIKGGTKKIPFELASKTKPEKKKPTDKKENIIQSEENKSHTIIKSPPEEKEKITTKKSVKYNPSIHAIDIVLGTINDKYIETQSKTAKETEIKENKTVTIFDPESPLKGDQIAYKHEIEIKNAFGKEIREYIATHCKGSIIDEDFFYGVIARESRFNKNAKSYTGVKGLGQLTRDTVLTVANINNVKARKKPEHASFFISDELRTFIPGKKKGEKGKYIVNENISLKPLNQIKMTLSYLLYLEELFGEIQNKKFKSEIIIAAYNLGPGKTKEILNEYAGVKNWEGLKSALQRAAKNGDITKAKAKETTEYVHNVKGNIEKSKATKLAKL